MVGMKNLVCVGQGRHVITSPPRVSGATAHHRSQQGLEAPRWLGNPHTWMSRGTAYARSAQGLSHPNRSTNKNFMLFRVRHTFLFASYTIADGRETSRSLILPAHGHKGGV